MKKLLPHIVIFFIGLGLTYLSFAFVQGTFDTNIWGKHIREAFVWLFLSVNLIVQLGYSGAKY